VLASGGLRGLGTPALSFSRLVFLRVAIGGRSVGVLRSWRWRPSLRGRSAGGRAAPLLGALSVSLVASSQPLGVGRAAGVDPAARRAASLCICKLFSFGLALASVAGWAEPLLRSVLERHLRHICVLGGVICVETV
jgi:hypothetical protein